MLTEAISLQKVTVGFELYSLMKVGGEESNSELWN